MWYFSKKLKQKGCYLGKVVRINKDKKLQAIQGCRRQVVT